MRSELSAYLGLLLAEWEREVEILEEQTGAEALLESVLLVRDALFGCHGRGQKLGRILLLGLARGHAAGEAIKEAMYTGTPVQPKSQANLLGIRYRETRHERNRSLARVLLIALQGVFPTGCVQCAMKRNNIAKTDTHRKVTTPVVSRWRYIAEQEARERVPPHIYKRAQK